MKKIIRLTEADLTRIVKRVLAEQKERVNIVPSIKIKISSPLKPGEIMMEYTEMEQGPSGCLFYGSRRGTAQNMVEGDHYFECSTNKLFKEEEKQTQFRISNEAKNQFRMHCGCDEYVKGSSSSSSMV